LKRKRGVSRVNAKTAASSLDAGAGEHDVRAVGQVRDECLGERERSEVVSREGHVPPLGAAAGAGGHDARVVEQARDREAEHDDLRGGAPHARDVGQVGDDR
jgi:hypothetical protein